MTRIRYKKNPDGSLFCKGLKSPTEELAVNITINTVTIFNLKGQLLFNKPEKTLSGAKKAAKKALISLGVPFENEVRPRIKMTYEEEIMSDLEHDQ